MRSYQTLLAAMFLLCTSNLFSQKAIYQSKYFEEYSKNHHTLAIVPFIGTLELMDSNYSPEESKKISKEQGYLTQKALENYFESRKKKKFRVQFQETQTTNKILQEKGISYEDLKSLNTQDLCKILGVEGIINGSIHLNFLEEGFFDFLSNKSDYGRVAIKISDGKTGKLLWKYDRTITSKKSKNPFEIINDMMKKVTRKFPYEG